MIPFRQNIKSLRDFIGLPPNGGITKGKSLYDQIEDCATRYPEVSVSKLSDFTGETPESQMMHPVPSYRQLMWVSASIRK